jgi:hypothetical protein
MPGQQKSPKTPRTSSKRSSTDTAPGKVSDLVRCIVRTGSTDESDDESGIELHRVETILGPARYGYDFETVEFLSLRKPGAVIDLPFRASYGLSLLRGRCVVVWRERDKESEALLGHESPAQFAERVGTLTWEKGVLRFRMAKSPLRGLKANWGLLPGKHGRLTPPNDFYIGSAFQVTLIALEPDTLLAVFSSDGPGDPDLRTPKTPSVS